ncbi:hypothetical protein LWC34_12900 [Kibdelosporangium philippinense]|uniref:Uncharacterized protein n=1 Tax=Kibdelosporangium philippinense TaxID=211113 RepID=A0ABS8ZD14_9PSEU|nr:hypothetical protein [Kibdelosporangium philippinense]MCE7003717.1 hypothetical protein [Kibdelosporangium philippinense]
MTTEKTWTPEACTLPIAEQPLWEADFDQLFAAALRALHQPEVHPTAAGTGTVARAVAAAGMSS